MSEEESDTSEIPELPPGAWKKAVRGKWYRPVKQAVSIRLDADVLAWLKAKGDGYQTKVMAFFGSRCWRKSARGKEAAEGYREPCQ